MQYLSGKLRESIFRDRHSSILVILRVQRPFFKDVQKNGSGCKKTKYHSTEHTENILPHEFSPFLNPRVGCYSHVNKRAQCWKKEMEKAPGNYEDVHGNLPHCTEAGQEKACQQKSGDQTQGQQQMTGSSVEACQTCCWQHQKSAATVDYLLCHRQILR